MSNNKNNLFLIGNSHTFLKIFSFNIFIIQRIYTGTVYGTAESPIVSTGIIINSFLLFVDILIIILMGDKGYHGNEADIDCECTILIKDHDILMPDFASFPTANNNLVKHYDLI